MRESGGYAIDDQRTAANPPKPPTARRPTKANQVRRLRALLLSPTEGRLAGLYDEMCAVAGRGLYHGLHGRRLGGIGVGLTLFELPALAAIVQRVVAEDHERRRRSAHAIRAAHAERVEASAGSDATGAVPPKLAVAGEPGRVELDRAAAQVRPGGGRSLSVRRSRRLTERILRTAYAVTNGDPRPDRRGSSV